MNTTATAKKYSIKDSSGVVIYINLVRDARYPNMFVWPTGGHITESLIRFERWTVCER